MQRVCFGLLPWLLVGCASQGPLRPPSLHLPAPVRGLRAERTGDTVALSWTNPVRTSDGVSLMQKHGAAPLTVAICRKATAADACQPVGSLPLLSGQAGSWHETLPAAFATGPARPLTYQVQALNGKGKGGQPVPVDALAGAAPHPVLALTATRVTGGVALHWQLDQAPGADHIALQVVRGKAAATAPGTADAARPALLSAEIAGSDVGGVLDPGARLGVAQVYTVQRTRTVQRPSGGDLLMSSVASSVTEQANALPKALPPPTGLEAVVDTLAQPEVELVSDPVDGAAGYLLFRAVGSGDSVPLSTAPVTGFTYTDAAVGPGQRLRYSIATVDGSGQVGRRGAPVLVEMPAR